MQTLCALEPLGAQQVGITAKERRAIWSAIFKEPITEYDCLQLLQCIVVIIRELAAVDIILLAYI